MKNEAGKVEEPDRGLTNFEIDDKLKNVPGYIGCMAIDQLPKVLVKPSCGVVNTHNIRDKGVGHWVAFAYRDEIPVYYDSFGVPPDDRMLKFLKQNSYGKIIATTAQNQNIDSVHCGRYCIKFIEKYMLDTAKSPEQRLYDAVYQFDPWDSEKNEEKVDRMKI